MTRLSVVLFVGTLAVCACRNETKTLAGRIGPAPLGVEVTDPVSGTKCTRSPSTESAVFRGRNYYFCDPVHRQTFGASPERFAYEK